MSKVDQRIAELMAKVEQLTNDLSAAKEVAATQPLTEVVIVTKSGQKARALQLLLEHPVLSTTKYAKLLGISAKNMQTLMSYLRDEGWLVAKGGQYSLIANDQLVEYVRTHKCEQWMVDRVDEYEAIKAFRAARAATV